MYVYVCVCEIEILRTTANLTIILVYLSIFY